ncbi:MAG: VWA-like domain-containing protein [Caulobacterales bacterium]
MGALELMEQARAGLMLQEPFYASLALMLELVEDPTCETAWVDGRRLGFNPPYVESLEPSERRGLIAHEVDHCARLHHVRRNGRELKQWNRACDFVINPGLLKAGFRLPKGGLNRADFADLSEEEVFNRLEAEKREEQKKQGDKPQGQKQGDKAAQGDKSAPGKPDSGKGGNAPGDAGKPGNDPANGNGSGNGKPEFPCGEVRDAAPAHDAAANTASEMDWRTNVRQALSVSRAFHAGNLPGCLQEIDVATAAPEFNWKEETRRFIDDSSEKRADWMTPNKRFIGSGLILPGRVSDSIAHLVMIVDDSSSIDLPVFHASIAEAAAAMEEGAADRLTVVLCNTEVHKVYEFERGDEITVTTRGNGGTRFDTGFAWVEENAPDAAAVIYLTDLDSSHFGPEPSMPVLWVAYGERATIARRAAKVPFGEILLAA